LSGQEAGTLQRQHHGLVAIAKWHNDKPSEVFQTLDVDFSLRHDLVLDRQDLLQQQFAPDPQTTQFFKENDWRETMFKFSLNMVGLRNNLSYNAFLKFGKNTKFPTLFQQISVPDVAAEVRNRPNLNPEKNRSVEIGLSFTREISLHPSIYGWGISGTFFQNHYDNKFRVFGRLDSPKAFYDNVANARLSGFEAKPSLYLYRKKITLEAGLSRYYISEKAAFPFKSDSKRTLSLIVDHAGYSFQLLWFKEGEQVGWLPLSESNGFGEVELPGYTNLDAHLSKSFELGPLKLFLNASGRNLLNGEEVVLQGIALRDRRYYLTVGAQY
jgi:outer membrane receptor protein involved in Fe transport